MALDNDAPYPDRGSRERSRTLSTRMVLPPDSGGWLPVSCGVSHTQTMACRQTRHPDHDLPPIPLSGRSIDVGGDKLKVL